MTDTAARTAAPDDSAPHTANHGVVLPRFGTSAVLSVEAIPYPQPEDDDVLVRVHAASVNPVDWKTRDGDFPPVAEEDLPKVLGRDLAGEVIACGPSASAALGEGARIYANIGFDRGAQAQFVIVKATELAAMPKTLDFVAAASVPLVALTAWQGLFDHGGLTSGQRVLIHGGAGGVGMLAVQFAKEKGATVFATAGADDLDFVRGIGADTVIDYQHERFEEIAADIDVVFDLIDGETRERSWGVLKQGGMMVSTLSEPDRDKAASLGVRAAEHWLAEPDVAQLGEIAALIDAGKVTTDVGATYPLDQAAKAYDCQEKGDVRGKVVITMQ